MEGGKAFSRASRTDPNWQWVDVGDAKSAYRISRFSRCPGEGEPIRWRFCLRPLKTVAKRVLFSCCAADAKVRLQSKTQISEVHFY
jgi:hypothetical protein